MMNNKEHIESAEQYALRISGLKPNFDREEEAHYNQQALHTYDTILSTVKWVKEESVVVCKDMKESEMTSLPNYSERYPLESDSKIEELFRNFIRTNHLTANWENFLMQNRIEKPTENAGQNIQEASEEYAEQITLGLTFPQKEVQKSKAKQDFTAGVEWKDSINNNELEEFGREAFYKGREIERHDEKGRAIFKHPTYEGYLIEITKK